MDIDFPGCRRIYRPWTDQVSANSTSWNDLSQNYAASKLWLKGQSPSDPKNFIALWKHETGSRLEPTDIARTWLRPWEAWW